MGLIPVSSVKTGLQSFAVIEEVQPQIIVPGHGTVTSLAIAQAQTRDLLPELRAHMNEVVKDATAISAAVKNFNVRPCAHLKHTDVSIPRLAHTTYREIERESGAAHCGSWQRITVGS